MDPSDMVQNWAQPKNVLSKSKWTWWFEFGLGWAQGPKLGQVSQFGPQGQDVNST